MNINDDDLNKAKREWALRCAYDERDVALINRLYPEPTPITTVGQSLQRGAFDENPYKSDVEALLAEASRLTYENQRLVQRIDQLEQDRAELIVRVDMLHADIQHLRQYVHEDQPSP